MAYRGRSTVFSYREQGTFGRDEFDYSFHRPRLPIAVSFYSNDRIDADDNFAYGKILSDSEHSDDEDPLAESPTFGILPTFSVPAPGDVPHVSQTAEDDEPMIPENFFREGPGPVFDDNAPAVAVAVAAAATEAEGDDDTCKICMSNRMDVVLIPCGHLAFCGQCVSMLPHRECPLCKTPISNAVKIYKA